VTKQEGDGVVLPARVRLSSSGLVNAFNCRYVRLFSSVTATLWDARQRVLDPPHDRVVDLAV
jgi:hypothetical protein